MGQASIVARMRTGDIRSVPLAFWLFAILTALGAYLYAASGTIDDVSEVLSLFTFVLGPLLFATAVAWANPADLRFLWGAAFVAAPQVANLIEMSLARFAGFAFDWGPVLSPSSFTWGLELIGVALIALAIGGIHERRNWLWPILGLAIFVIGDIENAFFWASNPYPEEEIGFVYPALAVAITFVGGLTVVAWSYFLGSSVEHGKRLFAIGSGLVVALSAFDLMDDVVFTLVPPPATGGMSVLFWPLTVVRVVAWVALLAAALREVPRWRAAAAEAAT